MSEGPIKQWRESHKPARVSTPDAHRVCAQMTKDRGYCGRKLKAAATDWSGVTCADCLAARRADGVVTP